MYIKAKVFTRAKKEKIEKISEDTFEVYVREKAERNMANKRVLDLLSQYFGKSVRIINGHHSPSKLLIVNDR